jgi:hypothetical protein
MSTECTIDALVSRMAEDHERAIARTIGDGDDDALEEVSDSYFSACDWASNLVQEHGWLFTPPVPSITGTQGTFVAANAMWEYSEASDSAPRYLEDWNCSACDGAAGGPAACPAAFLACGRMFLAHLLEMKLARHDQ